MSLALHLFYASKRCVRCVFGFCNPQTAYTSALRERGRAKMRPPRQFPALTFFDMCQACAVAAPSVKETKVVQIRTTASFGMARNPAEASRRRRSGQSARVRDCCRGPLLWRGTRSAAARAARLCHPLPSSPDQGGPSSCLGACACVCACALHLRGYPCFNMSTLYCQGSFLFNVKGK